MLGDTANKRAVRILLECILVETNFITCLPEDLRMPTMRTVPFTTGYGLSFLPSSKLNKGTRSFFMSSMSP